jgi:hypothetical protein
LISDKKSLDFEAFIKNFEIFCDLSETVCVFSLISGFLSKNLSIELAEERRKIGVKVLIPYIKLGFVLRTGAIETRASSQIS